MNKSKKIHIFETVLYTVILIATMSIPFFMGAYSRSGWLGIFNGWTKIIPFLCIFLLNNYVLIPKLLFKEKYVLYILLAIVSVFCIDILSDRIFEQTMNEHPPFEKMDNRPPMGETPPSQEFRPDRFHHPKPSFPWHLDIGVIVVSFLLIGFNTGIKSFVRWNEERIHQAEKEKQHLFTELAFLKHQISPHFFMNTLNNIHALIDIDTEQAKDAIIKLSRLMRYLLYESNEEKIPLKKEIEFIESYIELMRLRYHEQDLEIRIVYPENPEKIQVPASLFLSLIENAFKHGVNPSEKSYIHIVFSLKDNGKALCFSIENGKHTSFKSMHEASGIGHENIKKQLNIIYKENYLLDIKDTDSTYQVKVEIPIDC